MRFVVFFTCAVLLAACDFPADPEGTLDRARGGTLRVGVTPAEPWVVLRSGQEPSGVEAELVKQFARTIDAEIEWRSGSESDLMGALEGRQLDIVIAGLTRRSPWATEAALTRPYLNTMDLIAAPDEATAERLSDDLGGEEIMVEAGTPEAAKLEMDTDAKVVPVEDIADARGRPAAIHDWLLDDLGLVRTDAELDEHEHAMAVSLGENDMLITLERFLLDREAYSRQLLEREGTL